MIGTVTPASRPISGANMPPALTTTSVAIVSRSPRPLDLDAASRARAPSSIATTRVWVRIWTPRFRAPAASAWASPDGSSQPSVGSQTAPEDAVGRHQREAVLRLARPR